MVRFVAALLLIVGTLPAGAPDPVVTLPDSYTHQFENEWVKVVRVRYAPHAKLPAHAHTEKAAAYVDLNDGGPVIFRHIGLSYGAVTRPATTAGSFRLNRAVQEIHEVEHLSALPSEFLRVEFKTEPQEAALLKGRYFREPVPAGENAEKLQFENAQIRVTRFITAAGTTASLAASETNPSLVISLTNAAGFEVGEVRWIEKSQAVTLGNHGSASSEVLRFELKTRPIETLTP